MFKNPGMTQNFSERQIRLPFSYTLVNRDCRKKSEILYLILRRLLRRCSYALPQISNFRRLFISY